MDEHFFIYNNSLFKRGRPVISSDHPALQFGDGLFETMRIHDGKIINSSYHLSRILHGTQVLGYQVSDHFKNVIIENIAALIDQYPEEKFLRARLSVFRSQNYFRTKSASCDFMIEIFPIPDIQFNTAGIKATIYKANTKGTGSLSNLKNTNYLLSILAARHAHEKHMEDAIILNAHGRICETSIANIYFVEDGKIFTPSLKEGCVSGVMRTWLMKNISRLNLSVRETECDIERLLNADEVFLSNSIKWIEPVAIIDDKHFKIIYSHLLFDFVRKQLGK